MAPWALASLPRRTPSRIRSIISSKLMEFFVCSDMPLTMWPHQSDGTASLALILPATSFFRFGLIPAILFRLPQSIAVSASIRQQLFLAINVQVAQGGFQIVLRLPAHVEHEFAEVRRALLSGSALLHCISQWPRPKPIAPTTSPARTSAM